MPNYFRLLKAVLVSVGLFLSTPVAALEWSSTSLLLQQGEDFRTVPANDSFNAQVMTFEHANGWQYGSNFFFVDMTSPNRTDSEFYAELSPSLSFSKLFSKLELPAAIQELRLTATWELGEQTDAKLLGLGFDFAIPNVPVAQLNLYQRFSQSDFYPGKTGSAPQLSVVWMAPFAVSQTQWLFEGFMDYAWAEKQLGKTDNLLIQPRLWLDMGALYDSAGHLFIGAEHSVWHNKYGVKGVHETVTQLAVKWTF